MKMKRFLLLYIFALLSSASAIAQSHKVSGKIAEANGTTLPGVTVLVKGTNVGSVSDTDGKFNIDCDPTSTLVFSFVGYAQLEMPVAGKPNLSVTLTSDTKQLTEFVVIGSRNTHRTKTDTPVPVDVISIKDIASNLPQPDLAQMLKNIAPSFNSLRTAGGDMDSHVDAAQLRNQPPNQTLVLLNGKRRHVSSLLLLGGQTGPSTTTDLMSIPTAAIERVEILRDGASAQYGSDAIAGVMNIVLNKSVNKFSGSYYTSKYKAGDGAVNQFLGNYGLPLGTNGGYINISTELTKRGSTSRTPDGGYSGSIFGTPYLTNQIKQLDGTPIITNPEALANPDDASLLTDEGLLTARGLNRDDFRMINGLSKIDNGTVFMNMSLPFRNDNTDFYAFGGLNYRNSLSGCYYRFPRQVSRANYEVYPNGYLPQLTSTIADKSLTAGLRGKVGLFDVDFSNAFGSNRFNYGMTNSQNASYGSSSPTDMRLGITTFTQNTSALNFTHYFDDVLNNRIKGINVAFGAEMRVENFKLTPGQEESYTLGTAGGYIAGQDTVAFDPNCQCFRGFAPDQQADAFRSVMAGYADVEVDVTSKFLVGGAIRYENYSDFGDVLIGKVSMRYAPFKIFSVRGSMSTGFRAPSLQELNYAHTATGFTPQGVGFDVGLFTNSSSAAKALGIPKLKEENSRNASFGFAFQPLPGLDITTDAYYFKVTDKTILTGNFEGDAVGGRFGEVLRGGSAQFFTNAADVESKGLDLVASYNTNLGMVRTSFSLAANWNRIQYVAVKPAKLNLGVNATLTEAQIQELYLNRGGRAGFEEGNPRQKYIASASFIYNNLSAMVRGVYYGKVMSRSNYADDNGNYYDYQLGARTTLDVSLGYQLTKGIKLSIGGENILDAYPTRNLPALTDSNRFGYENYQMGFQGANYFGRVSFDF